MVISGNSVQKLRLLSTSRIPVSLGSLAVCCLANLAITFEHRPAHFDAFPTPWMRVRVGCNMLEANRLLQNPPPPEPSRVIQGPESAVEPRGQRPSWADEVQVLAGTTQNVLLG